MGDKDRRFSRVSEQTILRTAIGVVICTSLSFVVLGAIELYLRGQEIESLSVGIGALSDELRLMKVREQGNLVLRSTEEVNAMYSKLLLDMVLGLAYFSERSLPRSEAASSLLAGSFSALPLMDRDVRRDGKDLPLLGLSHMSKAQLEFLRGSILEATKRELHGDYMEVGGVWRGGSAVFVAGSISQTKLRDRHVWLADDFAPPYSVLRPSAEEVRRFVEYSGVIDASQLHVCDGPLETSLDTCRPNQLAVLRITPLPREPYQSAMHMLYSLFPRVRVDGFVLVCNWDNPEVQRALSDFWSWHQLYVEQQPLGDMLLWIKNINPGLRKDKWRRRPPSVL